MENGIPNDLPLQEAPEFEETSRVLYLVLEEVGRRVLAACDIYLSKLFGKKSSIAENLVKGEYSKARNVYVFPDLGRNPSSSPVPWHYDGVPISCHLKVRTYVFLID